MILGIATVVVLVLVAVALLPAKKRDRDGNNLDFTQPFEWPANFRQQQLNEEAEAIAGALAPGEVFGDPHLDLPAVGQPGEAIDVAGGLRFDFLADRGRSFEHQWSASYWAVL